MKIKVPVLPGDRVTAHNPLGKEVEGLVSGAFSVDITEEKTDVYYFVNGEEVNAKNCKLIKKEEKPVPFKELVIPDPIMPGTKTALLSVWRIRLLLLSRLHSGMEGKAHCRHFSIYSVQQLELR